MNLRAAMFLAATTGLCLLGAWHRFGDSGHAMGRISTKGAAVRHGFVLDAERQLYSLITTASVMPSYRGSARVSLEACPCMQGTFFGSKPVIDLRGSKHPDFNEDVFSNLKPRDRLSFWTILRPVDHCTASKSSTDRCAIVLRDQQSHDDLLKIPITFTDDKGSDDAAHH